MGHREVDEDDDLDRKPRAAVVSSGSVDDEGAAPRLLTPAAVLPLCVAGGVQRGKRQAPPLPLRSHFRFRFGGWACATGNRHHCREGLKEID